MTHFENVITFGAVILFFVVQDILPWVGLGTGIFTMIWLCYQLFRGIEKRREEKAKRREEKAKRTEEEEQHKKLMEKYELETELLRRQLNNDK